jgi:hypothetical protein
VEPRGVGTPDLLIANEALSQLSYGPATNEALSQLSYGPAKMQPRAADRCECGPNFHYRRKLALRQSLMQGRAVFSIEAKSALSFGVA